MRSVSNPDQNCHSSPTSPVLSGAAAHNTLNYSYLSTLSLIAIHNFTAAPNTDLFNLMGGFVIGALPVWKEGSRIVESNMCQTSGQGELDSLRVCVGVCLGGVHTCGSIHIYHNACTCLHTH